MKKTGEWSLHKLLLLIEYDCTHVYDIERKARSLFVEKRISEEEYNKLRSYIQENKILWISPGERWLKRHIKKTSKQGESKR